MLFEVVVVVVFRGGFRLDLRGLGLAQTAPVEDPISGSVLRPA